MVEERSRRRAGEWKQSEEGSGDWAARASTRDRRFTCCIEILGDNRLAWATRTFGTKIGLPAVWGLDFLLLTLSIGRLIVLRMTIDHPFWPHSPSVLFFFKPSFLFFFP